MRSRKFSFKIVKVEYRGLIEHGNGVGSYDFVAHLFGDARNHFVFAVEDADEHRRSAD